MQLRALFANLSYLLNSLLMMAGSYQYTTEAVVSVMGQVQLFSNVNFSLKGQTVSILSSIGITCCLFLRLQSRSKIHVGKNAGKNAGKKRKIKLFYKQKQGIV